MEKTNLINTPVLGFVAYSGTGKTTLLSKLIPLLKARGLSIALVKHSHHHFDVDHPGKDSHTLRKAGAEQVIIASKKRIAWIAELQDDREEPCLADALQALDSERLDLVLVEGFKFESFAKIEVHREAHEKPYLYPDDDDIIAIVTDQKMNDMQVAPKQFLDLEQPNEVVAFIMQWVRDHK